MDQQKEIESQAIALKAEADSFEIVSQEAYNLANDFGRKIKQSMKTIDDYCDPVIDAAHKAHKAACDQKKALYAPFEAAKKIIDSKQIAWYRAEQEKARELQRKADEEAQKKAEDEALANAQALQDAGMDIAAEEVLAAPVVVPKVTVAEPMRAGGESFRDTWKAEVLDLMSLVKAVAAGTQPLAYLEANMSTLNKAASAFKGSVQIPGVKIVSETILARRSA
jgi:hypothetical protein